MKITIAERLKPFSHLPGTRCILPFTGWELQAFPTLLKFKHLETLEMQEYRLDWKGPVLDFTVQLDLEKGVIEVFGHTACGYRRVVLKRIEEGIELLQKERGRVILPPMSDRYLNRSFPFERLSLGTSKTLDWEYVCRRRDLREILPVWFYLGQMVSSKESTRVGAAALLKECEKMEVASHYLKFFLVGFHGLLTPRLRDVDYQGIIPEISCTEKSCEGEEGSPLTILSEGAGLIRSLFFKEINQEWAILPLLPPEFHSGRLVNVRTHQGDKIDLEWSKKTLRRLLIHPQQSRKVFLRLQKKLTSYRFRTSLKEKGIRQNSDQPLFLVSGQTLFLDRFEK